MEKEALEFDTYYYPVLIQETSLDLYGHVNNANYLKIFEEARWNLISGNGYGLEQIQKLQKGPIILEIKIAFLKEVKAREEVIIVTHCTSYERKIGKIQQSMVRNGEICATAEVTLGLFDLKTRRLVLPTPEWLEAIGARQVSGMK